MPIQKSIGVTPTEQLLASLCENTFFSIWSYPNPFKADGKELCDVIAVFEDHVFLFFDRESRKFDKEGGDLNVQWLRWYKNAIQAQLKTANGAKRYINERPNQIYLDCAASVAFPVPLPTRHPIIHSIIVAHGAAEACKNNSPNNISGSLGIAYYKPELPVYEAPFFITLDSTDPVHVFDSSNLEIILKELDTIADFANYLTVKEQVVQLFDGVVYCGEEDFLAYYQKYYDKETGKHRFTGNMGDGNILYIKEGEWDRFSSSPEFHRKNQANMVSYFWDELIKTTSNYALTDDLYGEVNVFTDASPIMEMAKEPRISRRVLSEACTRAINKFPDNPTEPIRHITVIPSYYKLKFYVFLQLYVPDITDYNKHRERRIKLLHIACGVVKNKYPHLRMIVGIVMYAPKLTNIKANDYVLLDCTEWSNEQQKQIDDWNDKLNFLTTSNSTQTIFTREEFPTTDKYFKPSKIGRNRPCPCGSGKKYKYCCIK